MMPAPQLLLCIVLIPLVPLALAGLVLLNSGFGRVRGAAYAVLSSLVAIAVAGLAYLLFGFAWEGYAGLPAHVFQLYGVEWDWLAQEPLLLRGLVLNLSPAVLALLLQVMTVGLAALIPIGAAAGRWRLRSLCFSTLVLGGWTYPLFAHWVWGGGWLAQMGVRLGLGQGFLDAGGAATIQVLGGLTALAMVWILGSRRGKFPEEGGSPAAIPGHNMVYVLFGCVLMLPGWLALNSVGAMLFMGMPVVQVPATLLNTLLCALAAFLAAVLTTRVRFGKPDASLCANGWVGGLVSSSAICCFVSPLGAVLTGVVAGVLVTLAVVLLEMHLTVDDPGGAISVHGVAGIWGLLAVGIFPRVTGSSHGQLLAQVVGIATLLGIMLPMIFALNWLIDRLDEQRVTPHGERIGMDLQELGGSAYPEFIVYNEE